ncbi:MAG: VCBS repeat-containing protein [Planctomycetaceae bacterium]
MRRSAHVCFLVWTVWVACGLRAAAAQETWNKHVVVAAAESMINSALAHDFDGDGQVDVLTSFDGRVVLLRGPHWKPLTIQVFDANHSRNKPRTSCIHSCLMDVDGDGDLDFVGSNNTVFWLECPPPGFLHKQHWRYRTVDDLILGTHCLITGDVDRDGKPDLIANSGRSAGTPFPNSLTWLQTPGASDASSKWTRHVFADRDAPGGSHYTGLGDVNGDGRPDICCAAKGGAKFPGGQWFAWWEQPADPKRTWRKHLLADKQPGATNILPVDLNRDGHMDFFATRGHANGVLWFRGPKFEPIEIDADVQGPHCLALADIDGDGDIDAATCGREVTGVALWYENDGSANFKKHTIDRGQGAYDIRAIDMDGDQDLDLLIAGHTSKNVVWYENPSRKNDRR